MAEELNVPLNYFFCRNELSAELACVIDKMSDEEKAALLEKLIATK
ncbi:transcriptional regulator [Vibrio mimicus VM223]|nr:transcriptional regulator [Vibrio mimicus VM223]